MIVDSKWSATNVDLRQVVQYLRYLYPHSPLALVGFSRSASLLISYLGEFGSSSLVQAAVAVSPFWKGDCNTWIHQWIAVPGLDPSRDSDDIAVPLLVLHYDDDPLVPSSTLPWELFSLYPNLLLLTCPMGSHCGQLLQDPVADLLIADFLQEIISFTNWNQPKYEISNLIVIPKNSCSTLISNRQDRHSKQGKSEHHHHETGQQHRKRVESLSASRKPRLRHSPRPSCNSC